MTITNDAENVVAYLFEAGRLRTGDRLFYYDSFGDFGELLIRDGKFNGFAYIAQTALGRTRIEQIEPGSRVECDLCGADWTNRTESGGVYGLGTKAICPECAPRIVAEAERCGELAHIKLRCPAGKSFADWVRQDLR